MEKNLRPQTFDEFIGNDKAKKMLSAYINVSKIKHRQLDHILLTGPSSSGKTTLAGIIGNELGEEVVWFSGPAMKKISDLQEALLSLHEGNVMAIDEIHALSRKLQEQLFFAMEQFVIDIDGERIQLPHFTLVAMTTDLGGLETPTINRFPINITLKPYEVKDISDMCRNNLNSLGIEFDDECIDIISTAGRLVPRIVLNLGRRFGDFAISFGNGCIDMDIINIGLDLMDLRADGLSDNDIRYLSFIQKEGIVGLSTLAANLNIASVTVENVIEPYLFQEGYVIKTPRGRKLTKKGTELIHSL